MVAAGGQQPARPARRFGPAASLVLALIVFSCMKWSQLRPANLLEPTAQLVRAAELVGARGGGEPALRQAEVAGPGASRVQASADTSGGGGGSAGARAAAQPGRDGRQAAAKLNTHPKTAEHGAVKVDGKPSTGVQAAAPAGSAAQPAAPSPGATEEKLEQVATVELGAAASSQLGSQVLRRAEATPFNKCRVTLFKPKPMNDTQVTALLLHVHRSKTARQPWWAEVGSVPCRKGGCCKQLFSFRLGTTDIFVFQQIFRDHYMRALYSLFPEHAAPKYILDAGANAGYATALFKLLWPDAVVVSLEPDPGNFDALRSNTAQFSGVHCMNAGLWGRRANITISHNACLGCEYGMAFRESKLGEKGVPAYSVNDIAKMFRIPKFDFVKIDIEGAEGRVFAPDADLSWLGGPRVIALEVHDFLAPKFGLTAVSGHVAAAFAPHRQYQIATDNEHLFYIDTKHLAAAHLPGTVRTARVKP